MSTTVYGDVEWDDVNAMANMKTHRIWTPCTAYMVEATSRFPPLAFPAVVGTRGLVGLAIPGWARVRETLAAGEGQAEQRKREQRV